MKVKPITQEFVAMAVIPCGCVFAFVCVFATLRKIYQTDPFFVLERRGFVRFTFGQDPLILQNVTICSLDDTVSVIMGK